MRKTKIICTLGPATDKGDTLRELVLAGMDVARFNFSHADHAEHLGRLESLEALRAELGIPVATLLDTKGPEIRLGIFKDDAKIKLVDGNTLNTSRGLKLPFSISSFT